MAKKGAGQKANESYHRNNPNMWGCIRSIFLASLSKGQVGLVFVGVLLIIIAWRLPPEELGQLCREMLRFTKDGYLAGYAMFFITAVGWFFQSRAQRKKMNGEINRMAEEKNQLQKRLLPRGEVKSSKG